MFQDRNVKMFPVKSAEMFQNRFLGNNVTMFQDSSARMFEGSNVNRFLASSAAMFLVSNVAMFQDSSARMYHHRNAAMFQGNSAAVFLVNNASRFPSRSVMLLSQHMEGSKKVKENKKFKSDKHILAETLKEHFQHYSICSLKKRTDDVFRFIYLLTCSIYFGILVRF